MSKNILFFLGIIIGGVVLGNFLSKFIFLIFPENSKGRDLFTVEKTFGFSPWVLNLEPLIFTLGLQVKISFMVFLGIVLVFFLAKKFLK
ncbi:MAG: DUF4321 domain-containing protein [Minisyncoccales bacterium]